MLAGSHRNAWPDETGTGGRTNRNTHIAINRIRHVMIPSLQPYKVRQNDILDMGLKSYFSSCDDRVMHGTTSGFIACIVC